MSNITSKTLPLKKIDISVVGEVVVDKISYVSDYPQRGTKIDVKKSIYDIGGTSAAIAAFLGEFDAPVRLISSWGDDVYGQMANLFFSAKNIDVSIDHTEKTLVNSVYVDEQYSSRTIYRDTRKSDILSKDHLVDLANSSVVVFDRQRNDLFNLLKSNKESTAKTIIDTSVYVTDHTMNLFENACYSIIPEEFVYNVDLGKTFSQNIAKLSQIKQGNSFWVTLGEKGCVEVSNAYVKYFASPKISCIDNLGAGDVFRGAFTYGLYQDWNMDKIVTFSNVSAALQCTRRGNCSAIPKKEEVLGALKLFTQSPYVITTSKLEELIK